MCGIAGIFTPEKSISVELLSMMRDRLDHRGPDNSGYWLKSYDNGSVALANRRLAIIDLRPISNQPMVDIENNTVISLNGEIYNYLELRSELIKLGRKFRTDSDTEVLLQAYNQWGSDLLNKVNGMFSFIIWDEAEQHAVIARDRFGEKPLYYARTHDNSLFFASEIKALTANPNIPCSINMSFVDSVLSGLVPYGQEDTFFLGIKQFLPAHLMKVSLDGNIKYYESYWKPDYKNDYSYYSNDDLSEKFIELLERSIRLRLRSDVDNSACLSGGLDSSTLVAMIHGNPDFRTSIKKTISVKFPEDRTINEGNYIDILLKHIDCDGDFITPSAMDLVSDTERLHWHHEGVIPGPSMYLEWCVMRHARKRGYKVMLDGQGADELLAGYTTYFEAFQYDAYCKREWWKLYKNHFLKSIYLKLASIKYIDHYRRFSTKPGLELKQLKLYKSSSLKTNHEFYDFDGAPACDKGDAMRYMLALHLMRISLPSNLHSGDRNSMAHGVECRYPYLDYELVDFCTQLPDKAYIHNGWQKSILRRSTRRLLPYSIRWRPDKVGFAAPQDTWMRGGLKQWTEERIFDDSLHVFSAYDKGKLEQMWKAHQSARADHSTDLWQWASLAEFYGMFKAGKWRNGI